MSDTEHNPDRYMSELRQLLTQGRKKIGFLIGAGASTSLLVNADGELDSGGEPLIPHIAGLTAKVLADLSEDEKAVIVELKKELGTNANIEAILTKVRLLEQAIGTSKIHGLDASGYEMLGQEICRKIGAYVNANLPIGTTPFSNLIAWISGTDRQHSVEIFTPNYDLLLEQAFERVRMPYYDGFSGGHRPFFDAASVTLDGLPARWSKIWKIHGSLGWDIEGGSVVRTGDRLATKLIYPDHLKYDEITKMPYSALFDRLAQFIRTPDSLLICAGFSFFDAHITAVIEENLAANAHAAVIGFQYQNVSNEPYATNLARRRPNMSVYARDGAIINGVQGIWRTGDPPNDEWATIRRSFWKYANGDEPSEFLLGDFAKLSQFLALAQAQRLTVKAPEETSSEAPTESGDIDQQIDAQGTLDA